MLDTLSTLSLGDAVCLIVDKAFAKPNATYVWVTKDYNSCREVVRRLSKFLYQYGAKYSAAQPSFILTNGSVIRVQDARPERLCGLSLDGAVISRWCEYDVAVGVATCLTRTKGWMYKVDD